MKLVIFGGFIFLTGGIMWSLSSLGGFKTDGGGPFLMVVGFILGIIGFFVPDRKTN